jgi:hypothetical protein
MALTSKLAIDCRASLKSPSTSNFLISGATDISKSCWEQTNDYFKSLDTPVFELGEGLRGDVANRARVRASGKRGLPEHHILNVYPLVTGRLQAMQPENHTVQLHMHIRA